MIEFEDSSTLQLDFDLETLLERDPHTLFYPQLLRNLREELERDLGRERARVAALQMGCLLGMRDGLAAAASLLPGPAIPPLPLHPALLMRYGCTRRVNSALALHGHWPSAGESGARSAAMPDACLISMGYTSGWLSGAMGVDLLALETSCRADGDDSCRFTALERSGWQILDDPRLEPLLTALPIPTFRALANCPTPPMFSDVCNEEEIGDGNSTAVQLWPPLMVVHDPQPASALRALELLESDPAARGVTVVILNFGAQTSATECSPDAFQPFLAAVEARAADAIYAAPPETWEGRLKEISKRPLAETRSLEEAIGLGLQVSHAQGWKH